LGGLTPKQDRVQRFAENEWRAIAFDGDKSPVPPWRDADKSAHSKACGVGFWQDYFLRDNMVKA
jgi:hypothetical protein